MVRLDSPNLGAPSGAAARVWNVADLLPSETNVFITVDLRGDLNGQTEWADIVLNDSSPRRFFQADGSICPAVPDRAEIALTRAEWNALVGTAGQLSVRVECPPAVDGSECKDQGLTEIRIRYVGVTATGDCNGNQRLDVAETFDGTTPDCNANTVPDSCDIARGAAQDCNANEVPDGCELASTPALDCDANGIIDTCDLATGGTSIDCDQNGRIDSCQVTETPGTDCNGNLRPDACDVAGGTSADRDGDLQPDECQTVQVPGDFTSIQAAIDAAPASEMRIIAVAAGEFAGPVDFKGKPVVVRGAGAGQTVIAGTGGASVSVVRFMGSEPAISALERVSVRGGLSGTPLPGLPSASAGGGVLGIDAATSIRDCVIESNTAGFGGQPASGGGRFGGFGSNRRPERGQDLRTEVSIPLQSPSATARSVTRREPIPAATMPDPNQAASDVGSGSTPPVGMILVQGMGPSTAFTNSGPPTLEPGNSLTMSQPRAWALEMSVTEPQPGK